MSLWMVKNNRQDLEKIVKRIINLSILEKLYQLVCLQQDGFGER